MHIQRNIVQNTGDTKYKELGIQHRHEDTIRNQGTNTEFGNKKGTGGHNTTLNTIHNTELWAQH